MQFITQLKNTYQFIHAHFLAEEHEVRRAFVDRFDDEFLIIEADVSDFGPSESCFRLQFVFFFVNIQSEGRHT